jgi:hypothetical protein
MEIFYHIKMFYGKRVRYSEMLNPGPTILNAPGLPIVDLTSMYPSDQRAGVAGGMVKPNDFRGI